MLSTLATSSLSLSLDILVAIIILYENMKNPTPRPSLIKLHCTLYFIPLYNSNHKSPKDKRDLLFKAFLNKTAIYFF